jgi:phosphoesterase RecJ-like protein
MKKIEISDIVEILSSRDNFIITTHANPDGDALGSSSGLMNLLRENGKKADLLLPEPLPEAYKNLVPEDYKKELSEEALNSYSCCLCIDVSIDNRIAFGGEMTLKNLKIPLINIDHHPDNNLFGTENLVMPETAASAEIIYKIAKEIPEWKISSQSATLLLLGIVMDTGCFRFDNTSPEIFKTAADLLSLGADHHEIIRKMYFSKPLSYMRFNADLVLNDLKTEFNGAYAQLYLEDETLLKYGVNIKDIEGLIDSARMIDTVKIAAIIYKKGDGFKISLRSKQKDISVGEIAREFDGGGHEMAAGGFIKAKTLEEAEKLLLEKVEKKLK